MHRSLSLPVGRLWVEPSPRDLGRLEPVDLRDIWTSEASDFTPWLARAENLSVLSEALGMEFKVREPPTYDSLTVQQLQRWVACDDESGGSFEDRRTATLVGLVSGA